MASRKKTAKAPETVTGSTRLAPQPREREVVVVVNLSNRVQPFPLHDGTGITLQPFRRGGTAHKSRPVAKDDIPKGIIRQAGPESRKFRLDPAAGGDR